ncbi:MAG: MFS transporter [Alphaproteobacteria bacterium]|nr:MFS transporter [Alphaproteobacteria bacterium]
MKTESKQTFSIVAGHLFEHYDISLYGFFAVLLTPIFSPQTSLYAAQIASFGAFAAGFLMRPLGGLIFGYIGDRYGRKRALLLSISLAVLPTLMIGLLPSYEYIGLMAPLLLVIFRLVQGISVGGEYSGALIYVFEHAQHRKPAFKAGILIGSGFAGAVLGTFIGTVCTLSFMPSWGWRIPFIFGGIMGMIIYWLRRSICETPSFQSLSELNKSSKHPLQQVFSLNRRGFLCSVVFGGANLVPLYLATVYMNAWFVELGLSKMEVLLDNTIVLLCSGLLMPITGGIADRFGVLKMMRTSLFTLVLCSLPLYIHISTHPTLENYIILQAFLVICNACIIPSLTSFLPTLFPSSYRYTGISVSYTLGQATLGGLTPLLATLLTSFIGQKWAPALLLCLSSLMFLIGLKLCRGYGSFKDKAIITDNYSDSSHSKSVVNFDFPASYSERFFDKKRY